MTRNTLICGPVYTEIRAEVDRLPRGNEDFTVLASYQAAGGGGFYTALVFTGLGFPCTLCANAGGGIYGDFALKQARRLGLKLPKEQTGTAGCLYRLSDQSRKTSILRVPGSEGDLSREAFTRLEDEQYSLTIVYGDCLLGKKAPLWAAALKEYDGEVWFSPGESLGQIDETVFDQIISRCDRLILTAAQAYNIIGMTENDLILCGKTLAALSDSQIIIRHAKGVCLFAAGEVQSVDYSFSGVSEDVYQAALMGALYAGADIRKAVFFAGDFARRFKDPDHFLAGAHNAKKELAKAITER